MIIQISQENRFYLTWLLLENQPIAFLNYIKLKIKFRGPNTKSIYENIFITQTFNKYNLLLTNITTTEK